MKRSGKWLSLLLVLCMVMMLGACGSSSDKVDIKELKTQMLDRAGSLPQMQEINSDQKDGEDNFFNFADLDYDLVESYYFCYSATGTADEIGVIVLKDEESIVEAKKAVEAHLDSRQRLFREYQPEEESRANNAAVITRGRTVAFIMCDNATGVKKVFTEYFKNKE